MRLTKSIVSALFMTWLLLQLGCGNASPPHVAPHSLANASVGVVSPQWKSIQRVVELPGVIQAEEETLLYPRVPGYVRKLRHEIDIVLEW